MNTRPFYFGLIFIAIIAILANYLGNTDFPIIIISVL